jgi:hypothetical protein
LRRLDLLLCADALCSRRSTARLLGFPAMVAVVHFVLDQAVGGAGGVDLGVPKLQGQVLAAVGAGPLGIGR